MFFPSFSRDVILFTSFPNSIEMQKRMLFSPAGPPKLMPTFFTFLGSTIQTFLLKKSIQERRWTFFLGGDKVGCCKYCQVEVNSNFIQKDIFGIFVMTYGAQTFAIKDRCKWLNGRNIHKTSTSSLCGRRNCNCALHQLIFILPPAGRFFLIEMMWGFLTWGWLKSLGHLIGTVSK